MKIIIENGATIIKTGDANGGVKNKHNQAGVSTHYSSNGIVRYRAEIQINKKKYFLGLRDTLEEAKTLRKEAEANIQEGTFHEWFEKLKNGYSINTGRKKGVSVKRFAKGKIGYQVSIRYNGTRYYLGQRYSLEEATALRTEGEERIENGTFLEWYNTLR